MAAVVSLAVLREIIDALFSQRFSYSLKMGSMHSYGITHGVKIREKDQRCHSQKR